MWLSAWIPGFEGNATLTLFVYGLTLFTLGVVALLEWRQERSSPSPLGQSLHLLAAFAFLHAMVEWLEMFHMIHDHGLDILWGAWLPPARVGLLALSGLALGLFGLRLVLHVRPRLRPLGAVLLLLFGIWSAAFPQAIQADAAQAEQGLRLSEVWARYLLYLPGSLLAVWGLIMHPTLPESGEASKHGNSHGTLAVVFVFHAFFAGAMVPAAPLFPATIINTESFEAAFRVPIQIVRGAIVVGMSYYVTRFLRQFEFRRWLRIERLNSQLRTLSAQVITAQEEERKRIARDLHDDTAQALTALLLRLGTLERGHVPEAEREAIRELRGLTERTFENVRRLASELRPADLDDLGLDTALGSYLQKCGQHYGIRATLHVERMKARLPSNLELVIYRIVQEALTNAARHGLPKNVTVVLEQGSTVARVVVADDGGGFDVDAVMTDRQRGLGLFGMQERAFLVGGTLEVRSRRGAGTTVVFEAPIHGSGHQPESQDGTLAPSLADTEGV